MSKPTLSKIAATLGLSVATVSKALKDYPDISFATKKKVKELAEKLNYTPNSYAQSLRNQESKIIGLIIPEIVHHFFANIKLVIEFNKKSTLLELYFEANGSINVNCDLTNEPFNQEVSGNYHFVVKFGEEFNDENEDLLILPHGSYQVNIQQYIYESIVLALPSKRIHPGVKDGTLKSDILEKLEELSPKGKDISEETDIDPRWDNLKKLLTDK